MSEENVAVIRDLLEAWNAEDMERVAALYHERVIVRAPPDWPEPGPFVGRQAVMEQFKSMRETFEADSFSILSEFRTAGDRVLVRVDWDTVGRGPSAKVESTLSYTVRDGRILGLEFFWDHQEALAAAGIN